MALASADALAAAGAPQVGYGVNPAEGVAFPGVSFESLAQPAVEPLIRRFAAAPDVTLLIGAGASMEASLPSWPELIQRLLAHVAARHADLAESSDRDEWIMRTLEHDELLGAGAVVEVLADEPLDTLLPQALYGDAGAASYEPGPIALQVAALRHRFGEAVTLLTTNYDDLIERALLTAGFNSDQVRSYVQRRTHIPANAVPVTHLHGYAGRVGRRRGIVLTEGHYHRMQRGRSWQEQFVVDRLERSLCLFIGTSLVDPNLIRYLYGYTPARQRHAAIFYTPGGSRHGHTSREASPRRRDSSSVGPLRRRGAVPRPLRRCRTARP
jgi:hypothetical protein